MSYKTKKIISLSVLTFMCFALFTFGVLIIIQGAIGMYNLSELEIATQIAAVGYYKEDIHMLANYHQENIRHMWLFLGGVLSVLIGLCGFGWSLCSLIESCSGDYYRW